MKNKLFFLFFAVLCLSCSRQKVVYNENEILPRRKFVQILVDLHKADAFLMSTGMEENKLVRMMDSVSYYNYIFKKYKISRQTFKNTLYHYTNNLEKLHELETEVIEILKEELAKLDSLEKFYEKNDLWQFKKDWLIPDDGPTDHIVYEIKTNKSGIYILFFDCYFYRDNSCYNYLARIWGFYDDGTVDSVVLYYYPKEYDIWENYNFTFATNKDKKLDKIIVQLSYCVDDRFRHVQYKNIRLIYVENEQKKRRF